MKDVEGERKRRRAEINHSDIYTQWWASPELMLLYALMSRGNTQDRAAPSRSFGLVCVCVCVRTRMSLWENWCVAFCDMFMFLPPSTWEYGRPERTLTGVSVYMPQNERASRYEQWVGHRLMWTKAAAMRERASLFPTFFSPMSIIPLLSFTFFFSIPNLHFSVTLFPQPSSIWCNVGANKRKRLEDWRMWAVSWIDVSRHGSVMPFLLAWYGAYTNKQTYCGLCQRTHRTH